MKTNIVLIILMSILLSACDGDYMPVQDSHLVVEGWIEDDGYPPVIVTFYILFTADYVPVDTLSIYIVS